MAKKKKRDYKPFQQLLLALRQRFTLSLVESEEETLNQVEAALERLSNGQYGTCEDCGKLIPKERLAAIPYTAHCVNCASKLQS